MKGRHPSVPSISLCFSILFLSIQKLLIYIFPKLCHICLQNTPPLGSQHIKSGFQFIFFQIKNFSFTFFLKLCHFCRQNTPPLRSKHIKSSLLFDFFQFKNLLFSLLKTNYFNALFDSQSYHLNCVCICLITCVCICICVCIYVCTCICICIFPKFEEGALSPGGEMQLSDNSPNKGLPLAVLPLPLTTLPILKTGVND